MPVYEYGCPKCGIEFEIMRPVAQSDEPAFCPQCSSLGQKLVSVFGSAQELAWKGPARRPHHTVYALLFPDGMDMDIDRASALKLLRKDGVYTPRPRPIGPGGRVWVNSKGVSLRMVTRT